MKRSLLLCAAIVAALSCGQAMATVTLSLNLRYDNPNAESDGGSWDLLAKDDSSFGISAIVAVIDNIDFGSATLGGGIGAIPIETRQSGTIVEFVYGQDPGGTGSPNPVSVGDVGKGTAGVADDLFTSGSNPYNNFSLIASGTFGAVRPSFATYPNGPGSAIGGPSAAAVWDDLARTKASATVPGIDFGIGNPANGGVRGDGVATDGLLAGDIERDGDVDGNDLGILLNFYDTTGQTWDEGDVEGNNGTVDGNDLGVLLNFYDQSSAPPAIAAVPEPASVLLALLASVGMIGLGRRQLV